MWFLLACTGSGVLHTPDGDEAVRSALWFDLGAQAGTSAVAVMAANSDATCEPETEHDDPTTVGIDEEAGSAEWWQAQLVNAVTREGAWLVVLVYIVEAGEPPSGDFDLVADGWDQRELDRGAAGWLNVEEAMLDEQFGATYTYVATEWEVDVAAEGEVSAADDAGRLGVEFDLGHDLSGEFTADFCDNDDLVDLVRRSLDDYDVSEGDLIDDDDDRDRDEAR